MSIKFDIYDCVFMLAIGVASTHIVHHAPKVWEWLALWVSWVFGWGLGMFASAIATVGHYCWLWPCAVAPFVLYFAVRVLRVLRRKVAQWSLNRRYSMRGMRHFYRTPKWLLVQSRATAIAHQHVVAAAKITVEGALTALTAMRCDACLAAVVAVAGTKRVCAAIDQLHCVSVDQCKGHCCPFDPEVEDGRGDFSYFQHAFAYAMRFVEFANEHTQSPKECEAGREGKKKGKEKKKFASFMSATWEMSNVDDPRERANILANRLDQLLEDITNAEYENDTPQGNYRYMLAMQRYADARDEVLAELNQDAAYDENGRIARNAFRERGHEREGGLPVNRQGGPSEVLYSDDKSVRRVAAEVAAQKCAEDMEASLASRRRHMEIVAARTSKNKAKREKRESQLPHSRPNPMGGQTVFIDAGDRQRMGLYSQANGKLVFATCRHQNEGGKDVDSLYKIGQVLHLHFPNRTDLYVEVKGRWAPEGQDEVWYLTDRKHTDVLGFQMPIQKKAHVGANVLLYSAEMKKGSVVWAETRGQVVDVKDDGRVCYNATTLPGFCRTPVYDGMGYVLAGHLYGGRRDGNAPPHNDGEVYHFPPNSAVFKDGEIPPMEFAEIPRQGKVVDQPGLPSLQVDAYRTMEEEYKIWPLRKDKEMIGVNFRYHLMKPSTALNKKELLRFGDKLEYITDKELWRVALLAAVEIDDEVRTPFVEPDIHNILDVVDRLDTESKSAGFTGRGANHADYIVGLGDGDAKRGRLELANRVLRLYQYAAGLDNAPDAAALWHKCTHWSVGGKKDAYLEKKLDIGRTIQGPTLEMKVLWLVCYGEADKRWISREDSWVHAGHDFDRPVKGERRRKIVSSVGAGALDATAFDRYMAAPYIDTFFKMHMNFLAPGANDTFLDNMAKYVKSGPLVVSDGTVFFKERGNPSGFMNTLRLNCWANLVAWCYTIARRLQELGYPCTALDVEDVFENHLYTEICGDDSRFWALTDFGANLLDLRNGMDAVMRVWNEELPWSVKLEGHVYWGEHDGPLTQEQLESAPSMVSRCLFYHGNILWEPLVNVSRCLKRLCHDDGRTLAEEAELQQAAYVTLAIPIWLHTKGLYRSAALEALLRDFPSEHNMGLAITRAGDLYMHR